MEVGEYVRTKQGYIAKLENKSDDFLHFDSTIYNYYEESPVLPIEQDLLNGIVIRAKDYIIKHSKNIIDLIEVGDYIEIEADDMPLEFKVDEIDYKNRFKNIGEKIIVKSIITKEQMESIKYEV